MCDIKTKQQSYFNLINECMIQTNYIVWFTNKTVRPTWWRIEYRSRNNSAFPAASACSGNCAGNSLSEALDKNDNTAQLVATQFNAGCQNVKIQTTGTQLRSVLQTRQRLAKYVRLDKDKFDVIKSTTAPATVGGSSIGPSLKSTTGALGCFPLPHWQVYGLAGSSLGCIILNWH